MGKSFNKTWRLISIVIIIVFIAIGLNLVLDPLDPEIILLSRYWINGLGQFWGPMALGLAGILTGIFMGGFLSLTVGFVITAILFSLGGSSNVSKYE